MVGVPATFLAHRAVKRIGNRPGIETIGERGRVEAQAPLPRKAVDSGNYAVLA